MEETTISGVNTFDQSVITVKGLIISIITHILFFTLITFYFYFDRISFQETGAIIELSGFNDELASLYPLKDKTPPSISDNKNNSKNESETETSKGKETDSKGSSEESSMALNYLNFAKSGNDTSALQNIYRESSLNVRLRYPAGWTFVDQHHNRNKKFEGITLFPQNAESESTPYLHLETNDKELFNPKRYKFNFIIKDNVYYYNEPQEIKSDIIQEFYIRTKGPDDFTIKLIMRGKENFIKFQPTFYSMLKSFSFSPEII